MKEKHRNEEIYEALDFIIYQNLSQNLSFKRRQKFKIVLIKVKLNHMSINLMEGIHYS